MPLSPAGARPANRNRRLANRASIEDSATLVLLLLTQRGPTPVADVRRALADAGTKPDERSFEAILRAAGAKLVHGPQAPLVAIVTERPTRGRTVDHEQGASGPDPLRSVPPGVLVMALVVVLLVAALVLSIVNPGGTSQPITPVLPPAGVIH